MRVEGQATFLTAPDRVIHAWVHGPAHGRVRGAVVIAPALAREEVVSHRSMRLVAARAAEDGWVAIRLSWSGTTESGARPEASDPVAMWEDDLALGYSEARRIVGNDAPVHAIGLRIGAALLAASKVPFGQRVLWEPVSGAVFLRQYGGLRRASGLILPPVSEEGLEIGGAHYSDAEAGSIRALKDPQKIPTHQDQGIEVIREADRRVAKKLYGVASIYAKASPDAIANLVGRLRGGPRHDYRAGDWQPQCTARIHVAEFGVDVIEELIELGEDRLPASYTHPVDNHGTGLGAVTLAPPSAEPKDGPTGLWTIAARRLAARGVPTMRVERHHCGDGAGLDEVKDVNPYTRQGIADIDSGARWLHHRTGEEVTGVGLCVGGWLVAMAPQDSPMRRRVILNNVAWRPAESYYERLYRNWDVDAVLEQLRSMGDVAIAKNFRTRLKDRIRRRMPYSLWLFLGRRSLPNVPEVVMEYSSRGAEVSYFFGPEDGLLFLQERGERGLHRLQRRGRHVMVTHLATLDHALQSHSSRSTALQIVEASMGLTAGPIGEVQSCAA